MASSAPLSRPEEADGAEAVHGGLAAKMQPHATGGSFLNFLSHPAKTETAYTPGDYRPFGAAVGIAY